MALVTAMALALALALAPPLMSYPILKKALSITF